MKFKILEKITPSKEENKLVNSETQELVKKLKKIKEATIIIGGSDAKGTVIRKAKRDVDIFVAFDYKYADKSDKLADILQTWLRKLKIKVSRLHGSRDYFNHKGKHVKFEIIPILKIKRAKEAVNITDVSPLHVTYVKNKCKKKKLASEIRLAKAFCYAHNLYGAESYIKGFSGYALELLVIYYGSFMAFIKAAARWGKQMYKKKIIIDPAKHYKNKDAVFFQLNESKLHSPLILIDPLQKDRNAAAALSKEKFFLFIKICQRFLKKPSEKFFIKKEITEKDLKRFVKGKEKLFLVHFKLSAGKEDIIGAKLRKFFEFICAEFQRNDFVLKRKEFVFHDKEACFYFIIKNPILSLYKEQEGPPLRFKDAVKKFKQKWKKTKTRKARLFVRVRRKFIKAQDFLEETIKEKIKKEKTFSFIKEVTINASKKT